MDCPRRSARVPLLCLLAVGSVWGALPARVFPQPDDLKNLKRTVRQLQRQIAKEETSIRSLKARQDALAQREAALRQSGDEAVAMMSAVDPTPQAQQDSRPAWLADRPASPRLRRLALDIAQEVAEEKRRQQVAATRRRRQEEAMQEEPSARQRRMTERLLASEERWKARVVPAR